MELTDEELQEIGALAQVLTTAIMEREKPEYVQHIMVAIGIAARAIHEINKEDAEKGDIPHATMMQIFADIHHGFKQEVHTVRVKDPSLQRMIITRKDNERKH